MTQAASRMRLESSNKRLRRNRITRKPSTISGALVTVYDPKTPQIWTVPYRDRIQPSVTVTAPAGGYVVDPVNGGGTIRRQPAERWPQRDRGAAAEVGAIGEIVDGFATSRYFVPLGFPKPKLCVMVASRFTFS